MDGTQLKERREALGMNRTELGVRLDLPANTLYMWESGRMPIRHGAMLDLALRSLEADIRKENLRKIRMERETASHS